MNLRKLLSAILVVSLVFGLVSSALADGYTPGSAFDAAERMANLGLVKGRDGSGDYQLNETITRAEMVTILVRALGQESTAQLLAGAPAFADSNDHWASGYIALAKNLGITAGRTPTTFEPDAPVTAAEAIAFVVKFLGLPVNDQLGWPNSYLAAALEAGIATTDDNLAGIANSPAPRGMVFFFGDKAFNDVKLENGKTVYQTYVKTNKPTLSVDQVASVTNATSVTVTGKAAGHTAVYVGGSAITTNFDGSFSTSVALEPGENTIVVRAVDVVGNEETKQLTVTRAFGAAAAIEAADITVAAGAEVEVEAAVKDASGATITDAEVEGESAVGTFADGKFTAGTKAGKGTLTLRSGDAVATVNVTITAGALAKVVADKPSVGSGEKATLTAVDEHGNAIAGAEFSVDSNDAVVVNGAFVGTKPGTYKVTATVGEATATTNIGIYDATVEKYGVAVSAADVVANKASTIDVTVTALDKNGNIIATDDSTVTWDANTAALLDVKNSAGSFVALTTTKLSKGTATVTLRTKDGILGGQIATVKVSAGGKSGSATVELLDQVATSLKLSTDDKYLANNTGSENAEFKLEVLDQVGKPMQNGAYGLNVAVTGPAVLVDDTATDSNPASSKEPVVGVGGAKVYVRSKLGEAGTVTVTATSEAYGSATASVTSLAAQAAAKLAVSVDKETATANDVTTVTLSVQVTDVQGVPVSSNPTTVTATFDIGDTDEDEITFSQIDPTDDDEMTAADTLPEAKKITLNFAANGKAKVEFQAAKFVGSMKIDVADSATSNKLSGGAVSVDFKADAAKTVKLTRSDTINVLATNPVVTVTAQLYDLAGNEAKVAGKELVFESNNEDDVKINGGKTATVSTDENGKASVEVEVLGYVGDDYDYVITVDGKDGSGIANLQDGTEDVAIVPVNAVATSLSAQIHSATSTIGTGTAGLAYTLKVTAKDNKQRPALGETLTVKVTEGKTTADVVLTDVDGKGVYEGTFTPKTAGRLVMTITATTSQNEIKTTASMSVRAGAYAGVRLERADYDKTAVKVSKGTAQAFRVIPVDAYGNVAAKTDGDITVTFDVSGIDPGKYFEIRSAANAANLIVDGEATRTIKSGSTGVTFYVLSNDETGVTVDVSANPGTGDAGLVFTAE